MPVCRPYVKMRVCNICLPNVCEARKYWLCDISNIVKVESVLNVDFNASCVGMHSRNALLEFSKQMMMGSCVDEERS